ncbi:hypothetical protein quinque_009678 [Culex quinquefasciatus]
MHQTAQRFSGSIFKEVISNPKMAAKFILFCALAAVASSAMIPVSRQSQQQHHQQLQQHSRHQQYRSEPQDDDGAQDPDYTFSYSVLDSWSGDVKSQQESRQGDQVRGQYRMLESDGTERIVDYSADDRNGFNAIVRHQPQTAVVGRVIPVAHAIRAIPIASAADRVAPLYATSNSRMVKYYDTPLIIANRIRHN